MGKHALRGAVTAWLALIALQAVVSRGGSARISSFFGDVDNLVTRALSPDVPAIPDRRGHGSGGTSSYITPAQSAAAVKAANGAAAVDSVTAPGGLLDGLPSLEQYVNGGGLPGLAGLGQQAAN